MKYKILTISIIVLLVGYSAYMQQTTTKRLAVTAQKYEATIASLQAKDAGKVGKLKKDVLDQLKHCESGNLSINDAPILLDTNHRISIGMYMFQRATVKYYYKKLYNKDITRKEAVEISLSTKARDLASDIIFKVRGGIFNWANCAKQHHLITEVTIIKRIQ